VKVGPTGVSVLDAVVAFGNMKTVNRMWYFDKGDEHDFVRITGDCTGSSCPYVFKGYIDIELTDGSTSNNTARMTKAIIHLADLHGAKVNQKE
jgi:hypothetical protein